MRMARLGAALRACMWLVLSDRHRRHRRREKKRKGKREREQTKGKVRGGGRKDEGKKRMKEGKVLN